ncbi:MAG: hypothetical protein CFE22_14550 [Cytophagaceae bacterium BCCC1]|nr:MAG: hypothetical protein CFE22_14550 [Cytophagaceae bacterium BCCC1]
MKKILLILIIASIEACTGEKGEIGPQGETGAKGPTGTSGQIGQKGPTGDKGATGEIGVQGETGLTGVTPSVKAYFSDWIEIDSWGKLSSDPIFYNSYKSSSKTLVLSFIPNPDRLTISTFSSLGVYNVTHIETKEIVGSLYVFNSVNTPNNGQVIFPINYSDDDISLFDDSFAGLFAISADLKTTPKMYHQIYVDFSKEKYKSTDDFVAKLKEMKSKVRYIFIPAGLPAKNGRIYTSFKTYNELIDVYNIPR